MAEIKEITAMCKNGQVNDAYQLAKKDLELQPADIWKQRALGWALYYLIKGDAGKGDYEKLIGHIEELNSLDMLTIDGDSMIFDNALFQIAFFVKNNVFINDTEAHAKLSTIFSKLKGHEFKPSTGHSFLLQAFIKFEQWPEMSDFLEWWNLDNLQPEDYVPYVNQKGQKMMTLAERAFIAKSKALLKTNDAGRIRQFLPAMETLMSQHDEMTYPGYFYGKLLLALGSNKDEALKAVIPFARKKAAEFWVWQLLSDVFENDDEKKLACLLRAVHCRTQETFLGKVRIKLADLYLKRKQPSFARYHIDAVARCYASQGWHLPNEIDCWIHQPWFNQTAPDGNDPMDYKTITDNILCDGADECIAVVTYHDPNSRKSFLVYGYEKRLSLKLSFKVSAGNILKLHYVKDKEGCVRVVSATKTQLPSGLDYAKHIKGTISKRDDKEFAFLKAGARKCFVPPYAVKKNNLKNEDHVASLIVYDYDKKKDKWNWVCVNVKK